MWRAGAGAVLTGGDTSGMANASTGAERGCGISGVAVMRVVLEAATALEVK